MGLRINTNVASLNAQDNLRKTNNEMESSLQKLSSGNKITKAADDAVGLAISENIRAQVRGIGQANRNANDGISLIQVAEGSLNEISNLLIRLRELSVQAASDSIGPKERQFVDIELNQLKQEIQRISQVTKYNDTKLLNGEGGKLDIQIGTGNNEFEDRLVLDLSSTKTDLDTLGIEGISFTDKSSAQEAMSSIDEAITKVNTNRANLGAVQNRMLSTVNTLQISSENLAASNSRIRDVDVAVEASNLVKQSILHQAGTAVLAQANALPRSALQLLG